MSWPFSKKDKLYYSERTPLGGVLYWLDNNPEWVNLVKEIEEQYNILVYHITHEHTEFGELLDMFFVSSHEEEWEMDRDAIKAAPRQNGLMYPFVYVYNLSCPMMSEFGSIGAMSVAGGMVRTQ